MKKLYRITVELERDCDIPFSNMCITDILIIANAANEAVELLKEKLQEEEDWINILHITEEDMTKEKILGSIKHN
jgi:hypothetical protein